MIIKHFLLDSHNTIVSFAYLMSHMQYTKLKLSVWVCVNITGNCVNSYIGHARATLFLRFVVQWLLLLFLRYGDGRKTRGVRSGSGIFNSVYTALSHRDDKTTTPT
jgi:hypothetical protein